MSSQKLADKSKEELLDIIKKLKEQKRYGLVWEEKPEEVVEKCKKELPVLEEVKDKAILKDPDGPTNLLIEGDNYHALSVLNFTHAGKIDVIYIDPPYNRNGDFKYNDDYVDKEDPYKHSKWLSFMSSRLSFAKNLLRTDGVMFISIDDNELPNLLILCRKLFDDDHVDVMVWKKSGFSRDGKMKNTTTFRKDHEYIVVCYRSKKQLNKISETPDFINEYGNPDNDPRGPYKAGSISRKETASNPNHKNYYTVKSPTRKEFNRQFDVNEDEFNALNSDVLKNEEGVAVSRIYWGTKGDAVPAIKIFLFEERQITPYSVLLNKGTTTDGTKEVSEILDKDATPMRPKPTSLIATLIQLGMKRKNGTVLDFFSGTSTTGHSTLIYNKKYKDKAMFILCTNNESGIIDEYGYPRMKNVIMGINTKQYLSNLLYLSTTFIAKNKVSDDVKRELVARSTEMICVKEGTFDEVKNSRSYKIFRNSKQITGILFNLDALEKFKKEVANLGLSVHIYVFSLTSDTYDEDFEDLRVEHELCPIPESILEVYRKLFK